MIKPGNIVRFSSPLPDEIGVEYTVIEVNGDRALISANLNMPFNPQTIVKTNDLVNTIEVVEGSNETNPL